MEHARRRELLALLGQVAGAQGAVATVPGTDGARRVFALAMQAGGRRQVVVAALALAQREALLREARTAYAIAIPATLALALAGGYFLARRALAPVTTLATQAQRIGASTLHERLSVGAAHDELAQLARAFNELLARLDRAFEQQRQFMADASHELRTPVAVVRGEADVALARESRPVAEYRESLDVIRDEARRMSRLIDDLLLLARSDAGGQSLARSELYLDELVADSVRAVRALAAERGAAVRYEAEGELPMRGDEALLRRAVTNLLDNAIKYGGSEVTVTARRDGAGAYVITVADRGPGIPAEIRDRIFDRFVRGADGGDTPGAGLGLAIARRIAEMHGGSLELARTGPEGSEFRLRLPVGAGQGPNGVA
jgi:heavy metal sensor kinase